MNTGTQLNPLILVGALVLEHRWLRPGHVGATGLRTRPSATHFHTLSLVLR